MTECRQQSYETVIGLEVHLQFNTRSKIFCACANRFGQPPNTNTCPICLGLPGTLPVLNKTALDYAIKVALALHCQINSYIKFDRKNYYYPDLPKGYQLSQYDYPIGKNGYVEIFSEDKFKNIRVHRAHMEEDAGKLIHDAHNKISLIDYNRSGTPLMEIVTEPDIRSPQEAYDYLTALKLLLQYLKVSDCDMEKGSLRCDANISVRPAGETRLGVKSEIKNLNSFRAVKAALDYEAIRHRKLLSSGQTLVQETRLWDEQEGVTQSMRSKEQAHDYRYFPEPDLVPFTVSEQDINLIKTSLPEEPFHKLQRLQAHYELTAYDAGILIQNKDLADFFEACAKLFSPGKKICNWMNGPLLQELNAQKKTAEGVPVSPEQFTDLIRKVEEGTVSQLVGKDILKKMIQTGQTAQTIIEREGLAQVSDDTALEAFVNQVIAENSKAAQEIQDGKMQALGFLIGQTMKLTQGKANPKIVGDLIKRRLFHG
ncbi:MAG TPA: Asp-tRNA(Asn)/Glu-tRNA(Gln) amidotransferase subunit GatB [Candidatus Omnitrophota bacterium]|nr:Asp-tRNA(Asn)/Glu-tRNA(Gln) amidotransferase subunit GatB [Candidatus Omnitrophota bacterium]HQO59117.1 Asp-tRNA(Asn)/Glu-tRNA(Gln) amidotransferase subunit GatB [Candidatus Omnitrophota bacterium]